MEAVKRERASLMASLAALKGDTGKAGGELQQDDIAHLRRDLELKQLKLNELKEVRIGHKCVYPRRTCTGLGSEASQAE